MRTIQILAVTFLGAILIFASRAQAHLLVAQNGTLTISQEGTWLAVSLPASAFAKLDPNKDGVDETELAHGQRAVKERVRRDFRLVDIDGPLMLRDIVINLSKPHNTDATATPLLVLGRFDASKRPQTLRLSATIFGRSKTERVLKLRVRSGDRTHTHELTPKRSTVRLLD